MLWAQLLARIYEVLPLLCPVCGGEMRIISFITIPSTIERILLHLDLPHRPPRVSPARGAFRHEDLVQGFSLGPDRSVPEGRYRYGSARIAYAAAGGNLLRLNADAEVGGFYDGSLVSASLTPTWNASRHVEVSGAWQVNRIAFQDRDQERVAHVGRLRTVLMLNTRLSGVVLLQLNSATDALLVNLRLRYNPREGNDLYVVYNHGLVTDRFGYDPARPLTDNQTLLIKYSHTLRLER